MSDNWKPVVGDAMRKLNAEARASGGEFATLANEENRSAPSMQPDPIPEEADPVQWLIDRVQSVVPEAAQMGSEPLTTKAAVLAQLYQAQAMRNIVDLMTDIERNISQIVSDRVLTSRPNPTRRFHRRRHSRFAQIFRDMADAYEAEFE